jgi:hypothetical protein
MISEDYPTVGKLYRNRGHAFLCDRATLGADDCVLVLAYSETDSKIMADGFVAETRLLVTKLGIVSKGDYHSRDLEEIDWSFWWQEVE